MSSGERTSPTDKKRKRVVKDSDPFIVKYHDGRVARGEVRAARTRADKSAVEAHRQEVAVLQTLFLPSDTMDAKSLDAYLEYDALFVQKADVFFPVSYSVAHAWPDSEAPDTCNASAELKDASAAFPVQALNESCGDRNEVSSEYLDQLEYLDQKPAEDSADPYSRVHAQRHFCETIQDESFQDEALVMLWDAEPTALAQAIDEHEWAVGLQELNDFFSD